MKPSVFTETDVRLAVRCALAETGDWRYIVSRHAIERMLERDVTAVRVRRVLSQGRIAVGPYPSDSGWKAEFEGAADGAVKVVVAFDFDDAGGAVVVVTVIRMASH